MTNPLLETSIHLQTDLRQAVIRQQPTLPLLKTTPKAAIQPAKGALDIDRACDIRDHGGIAANAEGTNED
jgi:hypothetical protein